MSTTFRGFKNFVSEDSSNINLSHREAMRYGGSYDDSSLDSWHTWRSEGLLDPYIRRDKPRLKWARERYMNEDLDEESRVLLVKLFREWCFFDEYLILQKRRIYDDKIIENVAVKCAKRGNDVYRYRLKKRLFGISELLERYGDCRVLDQFNRSRVLCVNLTYDVNRCSMRDAWENIGFDWNRFISAVRKKYGRVQAFRVYESTSRGYPHIHALMVFEEAQFHTFQRQDSNGNVSLRIEEKSEFEGYHHSYIDIFAPFTLGSGIKYFIKYLGKVHRDHRYINDGGEDLSKFDLTLSMMWLFRKRSFSISRDLQEELSDLINTLRNSNFSGVQVDLFGDSIYYWMFLGVYSGDVLGFDGNFWSKSLDNLSFIDDYR